eukprot:5347636-Pyramimonas_sp.AAC.1
MSEPPASPIDRPPSRLNPTPSRRWAHQFPAGRPSGTSRRRSGGRTPRNPTIGRVRDLRVGSGLSGMR